MGIVYVVSFVLLLLVLFFIFKLSQLNTGKKKVDQEIAKMKVSKIEDLGSVKHLSILPVIDYYAVNEELRTEPGVSYYIEADETKILLDVGLNQKREHPSPLLQNMQKLGINLKELNFIFFSHVHGDHVGGFKEQREGSFSFSQGEVEFPAVPIYSPEHIKPSRWNRGLQVDLIQSPKKIQDGIASTGPIPRYLFLMGYTSEQSLAVHVEGKGIVLLIGCGHPTVEKIIQRAKEVFNEPIYGVIGGLHYPVKGGRIMAGPINLQYLVASDQPPWKGLREKDVLDAIEFIKKENPQIVSLSPHDSSDWAIDLFKKSFGDKYRDLKVGEAIVI